MVRSTEISFVRLLCLDLRLYSFLYPFLVRRMVSEWRKVLSW